MALVDTIPETDVTVPTALRGAANGNLPADWLRSFDGTTRVDYKMFIPVSYAMAAMHIAGIADGVWLKTTGRYRTYARQEALFRERYAPSPVTTRGSKTWNGVRWYNQRGAMAAVPGTSNHGLGIADDISEDDTGDDIGESINTEDLQWLKDNATSFGWALDIRSEPWHWHWHNSNALTQRTVDVLHAVGIEIEDLARFGFSVPEPTPGDDDMTKEEHDMLRAVHDALLVRDATDGGSSMASKINQTHTIMGVLWDGAPGIIVDGAGSIARTIKRIAQHLGQPTN